MTWLGGRLRPAQPDHNGQPVRWPTSSGKVVVVFFGYTQCPDVCPTTMAGGGRGQEDRSGADGEACRCSLSRWTPSATRLECSRPTWQFRPQLRRPARQRGATRAAAKEFKIFYKKCRARRHETTHGPHGRELHLRHPGRLRVSPLWQLVRRPGATSLLVADQIAARWLKGDCAEANRALTWQPWFSGSRAGSSGEGFASAFSSSSSRPLRSGGCARRDTPYSAASSCSVMPPEHRR